MKPTREKLNRLEIGKLPPQAVDLEEAVLGALMLDSHAQESVLPILKTEVFYKEAHGHIYQAITNLKSRNEPIDILTVTHELRKMGALEMVGGPLYISQLTNRLGSSANVEAHARIVLEKWMGRSLITLSSEISNDSYEDSSDVFELIDRAEKVLASVKECSNSGTGKSMSQLVTQLTDEIGKRLEGVNNYIPTGLTDLDRKIHGLVLTDLVIVAARPGMGKCLGKGTKVLMFDGTLKNVEDVVVGDQLMGEDSTPRNVLSLARGREMMYWVYQNKGVSYRVNESHILSLKRSRTEGAYTHGEVLNIEVQDYLSKSNKWKTNYKGYKVPVEFSEKSLPIEPYFLGVWLGDGTSESVNVTNSDIEIQEYLKGYAERLGLVYKFYKAEKKAPTLSITSGKNGNQQNNGSLQAQLRTLGVIGNKHIPQNYLCNSTENRLQLLAGLLDTDGYFNGCGTMEITQSRKELAYQIKFLADSLGFMTAIKEKTATIKSIGFSGQVWRLTISGNIDIIPMKVQRKKPKPMSKTRSWRHTGIKVVADCVDDYYGFEIDGSRLFLLEDMTVTHNTALALTICRSIAKIGTPVGMFSLEMGAVQLTARMISMESGIQYSDLMFGKIEESRLVTYHEYIGRVDRLQIHIDETPGLSIGELRSRARIMVRKLGVKVIVIDYLQKCKSERKGGIREQEINDIASGLKDMAKELKISVIALSQLSRGVESRPNKRPMLSDLRESGSIEQEADQVWFIYRPEYYGEMHDSNGDSTQGMAEINIAKFRNGSPATCKLKFVNHLALFDNLPHQTNMNFPDPDGRIETQKEHDIF